MWHAFFTFGEWVGELLLRMVGLLSSFEGNFERGGQDFRVLKRIIWEIWGKIYLEVNSM